MVSPTKQRQSARTRTPTRSSLKSTTSQIAGSAASKAKRKVKFDANPTTQNDNSSPTKTPRKHMIASKESKESNNTDGDVEVMSSANDGDENDAMELKEFNDELSSLSKTMIIENYFNMGRLKKQTKPKQKRQKKSKASSTTSQTDRDENDDNENNVNQDEQQIECDLEKLRDWLKIADDHLPDEVKSKNESLHESYSLWYNYLCAGFNLMFYGIGSKRSTLEAFCDEMLSDLTHLTVDAFYPSVNTRVILQCLETNLKLKNCPKHSTTMEWASNLATAIDKQNKDVILIIHNIDGPDMRENSQQSSLAELAKSRRLHIIASFDHVNAPLLWPQDLLNAFNFLFININTMLTYNEEIMASDSKLLGLNTKASTHSHTQSSLDVIWASLTFNTQMVLYKAARIYYSKNENIEFFDLYRRARDNFLVSSETALRQQLIELDDHHLITIKRHSDGNEYIAMNVDRKVMKTFLQSKSLIMDEEDGDTDDDTLK